MEIAVFIQNIQEERAEVALYIFSTQINVNVTANSTMNEQGNSIGLAERFQQTDRALEEVPTWPDVGFKSIAFYQTERLKRLVTPLLFFSLSFMTPLALRKPLLLNLN